jgi:Zn-dependent M28 family amino/carboxypeptidase
MQVRYQNFTAKINKSDPTVVESQNVEATQQGSDSSYDDIIIFNAHYDSAKGTVGANDDGSGTVAVLAAAYVLSQYSFKRTMKFVTFSGEEQGLFGSDAYVRELYDQHIPVLVEFNADGIGRATTAEYGRKIRLSVTEDTGWITDIMQNMTKEYGLNFNITTFWKVNRDLPIGFSDYYPFARFGYESISIWEVDGDPNYHSPQDNISNINFSYLVNTTRHIAATMAILADTEVEVPQVYIANPRAGKIIYNDTILKNIKYVTSLIIDKTNIYAEVKQGLYAIDRVEFYYGNKLLFTDTEKPYEYMLNKRSIGLHKIKVVVYDSKGNTATDQMKILFFNIKTK